MMIESATKCTEELSGLKEGPWEEIVVAAAEWLENGGAITSKIVADTEGEFLEKILKLFWERRLSYVAVLGRDCGPQRRR